MTNLSKYLIEIGTEELPHKFIAAGLEQLKTGMKKLLEENKVEFSAIQTLATPRRLTLVVEGLSTKSETSKKLLKGPAKAVAFLENGDLSPAGMGFAKKNGVEPSELFVEDGYVFANIEEKSKSAVEIIQNSIEKVVLKLQGSHFMRWGDLDVKFQRPIRWIVSLLDENEVPIEIAGVKSSRTSRGHRFAEKTEVAIASVDSYKDDLYSVNVIADYNKRKETIKKLATEKVAEIGANVILDEDLLDEVTCLTEWCVPVMCDFDEKYLKVPEKVLVTVMASHQRYFPIYKSGKLLNKYITIANYVGNAFENIKLGNEKVIKARFDDAIFFFNEDTKRPFDAYLEDLKGITFQKGLGSMFDKTNRIVEISKYIKTALSIESKELERVAELSKCDLATRLVFEFTELQGYIGADYALAAGETPAVAKGIMEHYFPLSAQSELPESIEGVVVSIADKIDTVCATFASGVRPSGSQDPLGIRRATLGILKIIAAKGLELDITALIKKSVDILPIEIEDKLALIADIKEFFEQRLLILYAEKYRKDILEACLNNENSLAELQGFFNRVEVLSKLVKNNDYAEFHESINRVIRILKSVEISQLPDKTLFNNPYEQKLFECAAAINQDKLEVEKLQAELFSLVPFITEFFDNVLVMDENVAVKNNRLALLSLVKQKFDKIADFSKVVF